MRIFKNFEVEHFKALVERYAKFQKVMLLFDENVSNLEIEKLYKEIKEICIFNKMNMAALNEKEINNGYKLLIFICSANSFLKVNFNLADFVNIFIPVSQNVLPFFINSKNKISQFSHEEEIELNGQLNLQNKDFIFMPKGIDVAVFYSFYFNRVVSCFKAILLNENLNLQYKNIDFFTQQTELEFLKNDFEYVDLKILKQLNLDYKFLPYLDYYFLLAFSVLITAIKQKSLMMVDVYKQAKDNFDLINLYYAKIKDNSFYEIIDINFLSLKDILTVSFKNLTKIKLDNLPLRDKDFLIAKIKEFCKNNEDIFVYLFLFNLF